MRTNTKGYIVSDATYFTFMKRQKYSDRDQICGCQDWGWRTKGHKATLEDDGDILSRVKWWLCNCRGLSRTHGTVYTKKSALRVNLH